MLLLTINSVHTNMYRSRYKLKQLALFYVINGGGRVQTVPPSNGQNLFLAKLTNLSYENM
jgi:hypothetical protein